MNLPLVVSLVALWFLGSLALGLLWVGLVYLRDWLAARRNSDAEVDAQILQLLPGLNPDQERERR